jgi:hypothetical protein
MNIFRRILGQSDAPEEARSDTGGVNAEASPELAGPTDSDTEGHPDFLWDPRIAPASPASAETPESLPEELSLVYEEIELQGNRSQGKVEYSWKVEEGAQAPEDDVQFVHHHDSGLDGPRSDGDLVQADAAATESEPQAGTVMVDDWATRGVAPPPPIDTITGDDGEHDPPDGAPDTMALGESPGGVSEMNKNELIAKVAEDANLGAPPDGAPDTMALGESPGGVSEMNKNELIAKVAEDANLGAPPEAAPDTMALGESPADASEMTKSELIDTLHKSFEPASDDGPSTMVELSDTSETGAVLAQYGETDLEFVSRHLEAPQDGDEIDDPEL